MPKDTPARPKRATKSATPARRPTAPRRVKEKTIRIKRPAGTPDDAKFIGCVAHCDGFGGFPEIKRGDVCAVWMNTETTDGEIVGLEIGDRMAVGQRLLTLRRGVKLRTERGDQTFRHSQIKQVGRVMHVERGGRIVLDLTKPKEREAEASRVNPHAERIDELRDRLEELHDITDESERLRTLHEIEKLERAAAVDPSDEWAGFDLLDA